MCTLTTIHKCLHFCENRTKPQWVWVYCYLLVALYSLLVFCIYLYQYMPHTHSLTVTDMTDFLKTRGKHSVESLSFDIKSETESVFLLALLEIFHSDIINNYMTDCLSWLLLLVLFIWLYYPENFLPFLSGSLLSMPAPEKVEVAALEWVVSVVEAVVVAAADIARLVAVDPGTFA